jgi:hypothetical protein
MSWLGTSDIVPRVIIPFAAPAAVSTVTPLMALTSLGNIYGDLFFTVRNHDLVLRCAMYVDTSQSGVAADGQPSQVIIQPDTEWTIPFRDVLSLYFALSASGDPEGGFASVNVSFQVAGRNRMVVDSDRYSKKRW